MELRKLTVGDYDNNCYLLVDRTKNHGFLIDPGDQADEILKWVEGVKVTHILITHGHGDHVGALEAVREELDVPVGIHPKDMEKFELKGDFELVPGEEYEIGEDKIEVIALPGHTPGSVGLKLVEAGKVRRVIVGDAIFPGGPGHTETPEDLRASLEMLEQTVFQWDDETELYPGHGQSTTVGAEREAFEAFWENPLPPDLCGDVSWS